jgi:hypothetical protein
VTLPAWADEVDTLGSRHYRKFELANEQLTCRVAALPASSREEIKNASFHPFGKRHRVVVPVHAALLRSKVRTQRLDDSQLLNVRHDKPRRVRAEDDSRAAYLTKTGDLMNRRRSANTRPESETIILVSNGHMRFTLKQA